MEDEKTLQDLMEFDLSDSISAPYNVTTSTKERQEHQKQVLLSEALRAVQISDKWKAPTIDALTTLNQDKPGFVENLVFATGQGIKNTALELGIGTVINAVEDPKTFAFTTAGALAGARMTTPIGVKAGASFGPWGSAIGGFITGTVGAAAGGLGVAEIMSTKKSGLTVVDYTNAFNTAAQEYSEALAKKKKNEITEEEFADKEYKYKTERRKLHFVKNYLPDSRLTNFNDESSLIGVILQQAENFGSKIPMSPLVFESINENINNLNSSIKILEQEDYQTTQAADKYFGSKETRLSNAKTELLKWENYKKRAEKINQELGKEITVRNDIVGTIDGRNYPEKTVADSIITWGANVLKDNQDWNAFLMEQRGMNPDDASNIIGNGIAYIGVLAASSYGYKGALKKFNTKTVPGVYKVSTGKPKTVQKYSREQLVEKTEQFGKGMSFFTMSGEYTSQNMIDYIEATGDKELKYYKPDSTRTAMAAVYGAIGTMTEYDLGGIDTLIAGSFKKVGIKNTLLKAGGKIAVQEGAEEGLQSLEEFLARKVDGTTDKTWGEALTEMVNSAAWGAAFGGTIGTGTFYKARRNLIKGIMKYGNGRINQTQAAQVADAMIESAENTMSYHKKELWDNLRSKVALMYKDTDIDNKEANIDSITDLEFSLISMDSTARGINIEDNPIFKGEVNELGWFRGGIPEARRAEITALNDEIKGYKEELAKLNEAKEKDWNRIDEIENKLTQANQYVLEKLSDLERADAKEVRRILKGVEDKYLEKEKEKATKKAIKSGSVDVIREELQKAGFRTRDLSGTQIKEYAKLNWELLEGKDLGQSQRRGSIQIPLTAIEQNVESGNAVLLRAGYTQEQIDKMDDETWNRAIQTQYRKEMPETKEPEYTEEDLEGVEFQKEVSDLAEENARLDEQYPAYKGETINIDGKERTVYNSNGDRIAKSAEALTNFWRWFGDSKVVDEQGRPLVVYHGTPTGTFDTFYEDSYFTADKEIADRYQATWYSAMTPNKQSTLPKTYSVYLKMENPFDSRTEQGKRIIKKLSEIRGGDFDLGEYGLVDWTNAQDLTELLEENYSGFDGLFLSGFAGSQEYVAFEPTQIKSVDNRGTFSSDTGNIYLQSRTSGKGKEYRGAYIPTYRFILRANKMDASTLSHELAHDWFSQNFELYRSGNASPEFMRAWGALEKALGIDEKDPKTLKQASETFARGYEAWLTDSKDWTKFIDVDDKDKDAVIKLMQDYQNELRDIYNDINNPYFKETWGKLGELKPELKAWFDSVVNITDLDRLVKRGEMTEAQAEQEKLNRAIDTVIENTTDPEAKQSLQEFRTLNDTKRYEVEGGNKNALQERLSNLAREIDENNMISKGDRYDTRRDMLKVAEAADNFVKTRLEDALAIINGQMAEVEGLYKEDIYTALERLAIETGDMNLLDELKNSEIANRLAKELGQRVAGFRNWKKSTDVDVVSYVKSLDTRFNKALENKKAQKEFNSALDLLNESVAQQDKEADKELDSTLKELECK